MSEQNECVLKEAHEQRFDKIESDIDTIYGKVNKIDKDLAVSNSKILTTLESLSKLPEVLTSVQTTMVKMQCSIDATNKKTDDLTEDVSSLKQTVSDVEQQDFKEYKEDMHEKKLNKLSVKGQIIVGIVVALATAVITMVSTGVIKL